MSKGILCKWKSKTVFFKVMAGYVVVFAAVLVIVCLVEWNKLKVYQKSYEEAKEASSPWLYINQFMEDFTEEDYRNILLENIENDSPYYTKEQLVDCKMKTMDFKSIEISENEKYFSKGRPVYDLTADGITIATICLGVSGTDEFGFNIWNTADIKADTSIEYQEPVKILVDSTMKVSINGIDINPYETAQKAALNIGEYIGNSASGEYNLLEYSITKLIEGYDIDVSDNSGSGLTYVSEDGIRDYTQVSDEGLRQEYEAAVDRFIKKYIGYANKHNSLDEVLGNTVKNGQAYTVISSADEALSWVKKPDDIKYNSEQISNLHRVGNDVFYCDVHYEIEKVFNRPVSEKLKYEKIEYSLVLKKSGGVWLLDTMVMK